MWLAARANGRRLLLVMGAHFVCVALAFGALGLLHQLVDESTARVVVALWCCAVLLATASLLSGTLQWASPEGRSGPGVLAIWGGAALVIAALITGLLPLEIERVGVSWQLRYGLDSPASVVLVITQLLALMLCGALSLSRAIRLEPNDLLLQGPYAVMNLAWLGGSLVYSMATWWMVPLPLALVPPLVLAIAPLQVFTTERAARIQLTPANSALGVVQAMREVLLLVGADGRIDYTNDAARRLLGHDPAGAPLGAVLKGAADTGRARLRRADGEEVPVALSVAPLPLPGGGRSGRVVTAVDVSELQEALAGAEAALEARARFLAMMSHEIRTPMNAVLGFARLLEDTPLDAEQRRWVKIIDESAGALIQVINDVLDFSKIEAGQLKIGEEVYSPRRVLEDALEVVSLDASQRQLALELRSEGLPGWVRGDPSRLRQVVLNLLSNALKFTERGGVTVTAGYGDGALRIEVRDTGVGIPEAQQEALFDAFIQADTTDTRRHGGTGLGLTISRRLARLMGGDLTLESAPGQGSAFTLTLAAPPAAAPAAQPAAPAVEPLGPLAVLVVDDNPVNRLMLRTILGRLGLEPDEVPDGLAGVEACRRRRYDVVLMDLQMPGMDGYQAISAIAGEHGEARPRLVAHSANVIREEIERAVAAGADAHLPKPATPVEIEQTLRRLMAA